MNLYQAAAGQVLVALTCADMEATLRKISDAGITIYHGEKTDDMNVKLIVSRRDFPALQKIARRRGDGLILQKKQGSYWGFQKLLHRPVLLWGLGLILALSIWAPSRVLFVRVEGNETVPARMILEAAQESGIRFGASRREVRSEKMKNLLLGKLPRLQWAGVNTRGSMAVITVRERPKDADAPAEKTPGSIVAVRDGSILSCTATRGTLLCQPGETVQEGQVLISGYEDRGLQIVLGQASGEIMARTKRSVTAKTPSDQQIRTKFQSEGSRYSLRLGKKRINFFKGSGICGNSCVKMYSEYVLTLPGGFALPVAIIKETIQETTVQTAPVDSARTEKLLTDVAERCLTDRMISGTVLLRKEALSEGDGVLFLAGDYDCTEMIGRFRREQIGENHGKTD